MPKYLMYLMYLRDICHSVSSLGAVLQTPFLPGPVVHALPRQGMNFRPPCVMRQGFTTTPPRAMLTTNHQELFYLALA